MMTADYPPGVTGNEPHLTGEWPCPRCGGEGGDVDWDPHENAGSFNPCWFCGGSGKAPEDPPRTCPGCGEDGSLTFVSWVPRWYHDLDLTKEQRAYPDEHVYCNACGEVN